MGAVSLALKLEHECQTKRFNDLQVMVSAVAPGEYASTNEDQLRTDLMGVFFIESFGQAVDQRFQALESEDTRLHRSFDDRIANIEKMAQGTLSKISAVELTLPLHEEQLSLLREMALGKEHWSYS